MTAIHLVLMEAACTEMVLCHCTVSYSHRQSWNLHAYVAGLHCSFVGVKYKVLLLSYSRGSIPKNLDKNINWTNNSSFSCPFSAGVSSLRHMLLCKGVAVLGGHLMLSMYFPYMWLSWCGGNRRCKIIRWFCWAVACIRSCWYLCSLLFSGAPPPGIFP